MDTTLTILIIEDIENDVQLLKLALKREHIDNPIQVVRDGEEAINYLRGDGIYADRSQHPFPKIIFTDLKMPRMDGFEVLQWLRRHPDCGVIPLIILSASAQDEDIKRAYQLGANAYLVKPNKIQDLQDMVRTAFTFWKWCAIPSVSGNC